MSRYRFYLSELLISGLRFMDKEHLPMAEWGFTQFDMPQKADIVDIVCHGFFLSFVIMCISETNKVF